MIISMEGMDQAGKSTQTVMLAEALQRQNVKVRKFDFPDYDTQIGKVIRHYLDRDNNSAPQVIHCLLSANRWEHLESIRAAESENDIVIMNRYYHSNLVYGLANGMDKEWLEGLDSGLPESDLVIMLDISADESFRRQASGRDRFESDRRFLEGIRGRYQDIAKIYNWKVINAARPKEEVHKDILDITLREHERKPS